MGEWISVKDGLPELNEAEYCGLKWRTSKPVSAICGGELVIAKLVAWFEDPTYSEARWETENEFSADITYWMPLPEMPIEG